VCNRKYKKRKKKGKKIDLVEKGSGHIFNDFMHYFVPVNDCEYHCVTVSDIAG
jgi:hypothetical protein